MNLETRQAYSEVDIILNLIGEELANKIPNKLREFFEREKDKDYIPKINNNIPIREQKLKRKTIVIIAGLNLQYWCNSDDERSKLLEIYSNNEKKFEEKYNINNIFKEKNKSEKHVENNRDLIEVNNQKWYQKIMKKFKNFFSN